jgi:SAM-dependent methyltransferase
MRLLYTRLVRKALYLARPGLRVFTFRSAGEPVSRVFGTDRGQSIDRYWIERYLARHADAGPGAGIEVGEVSYLRRFFPAYAPHYLVQADDGGAGCVVCDLERGDPALAGRFDVLVATQVFNFVYETRAALRTAAQLLKPGGRMLGSVGGITQISRYDADRWGHYYSFTVQSWERLLREVFDDVSLETYGNVDTACAFLHGLCAEEVDPALLDRQDPDYVVNICFRAVKRG